jgi:5-methylcytosine-specific restriction protein A
MHFQLFHKNYFGALDGSYSIVTAREEYDSQITLTDVESEMVIDFFGVNNIQVGNVQGDPLKSQKTFLLYPSLQPVTLNLVFPKPEKPELRLYLSIRAGFKPKSGEIWFLYIDSDNQIIIGSIDENSWNDLDHVDAQDDNYLEEIQEVISENEGVAIAPEGRIIQVQLQGRLIYQRNPLIAIARLTQAAFVCEVDNSHQTFISQKTRNLYVEAHHLVPMKFQSNFNFPLDCFDNIISLCPNCHRGIHLGIVEHKRFLINSIFGSRPVINNFSIDNLYSFYNSLPTQPIIDA